MTWEYNNFYLHFPGQAYRGHRKYERHAALQADLDRVLEELDFDLLAFQELMEKKSSLFRTARLLFKNAARRDMTPDEQSEEARIGAEEEAVYTRLAEIVRPVYERMRQAGYADRDLCR